ncbi:formate dehydrogenase subunit gamma [Salisediminibacterium beveridgei]|uniref:Formate dehydrogenase-O, gamma subunit n=1 Tax=Salisediminibacterium beveridgei TaxID=632773 RepID=A0A1D7QUX1_9BACI|nr:cytochrome b/b6 domain-containing protein [Salisediminibacterium beveridgei]AOM82758.1 Formate dehydrogenase -O, gamma subunit [Salisediminibacterium beveridgei]
MSKTTGKMIRQPKVNRFVHWTAAVSIIMLIITGLGQMPLYGRYLGPNPPVFLEWLQSYEITLWLHYTFASILIFTAIFHLIHHLIRKEFAIVPRKGDLKGSYHLMKAMILKKPEPPSHKYLPEQRLAYALFAVSILLLVVTGAFKVYQNVAGGSLSNTMMVVMTTGHNIGTVLIIFAFIGHMAAFLFKDNRKMLPGMFTGKVDQEYVKHRHSLWYDELKQKKQRKNKKIS